MLQIIKDSRPSYSQEIINKLDEYSYRNKRYQINFALVLIYCKKDINLDEIIDVQRRTDRYISLDKNLCCVVFDSIDYASSKKVASNLQKQVEESCLNEEFFMGVITSIEYESASKMTNYLFNMLEKFLYNLEVKNKLTAIS
ncbi:hypothetical protein [Sulfurimonas sp.]|uniref:hypothetical protein n=1 Tax=Sulfurimonas sp. TaxID=2022749 RepID=UPI0019E8828C|nr:hypothetical protein [Sulfurimonas sp.]MBE0513725.1 hypothetical protein [Sulfurimonas sp.]